MFNINNYSDPHQDKCLIESIQLKHSIAWNLGQRRDTVLQNCKPTEICHNIWQDFACYSKIN